MHPLPAESSVVRRDDRPALLLRGLQIADGVRAVSLELSYPEGAPEEVEALQARPGRLSAADLVLSPRSLPGAASVELCPEAEGPVVRWTMPDLAAVTCRPEVYVRTDGRPVLALSEVRVHGPSAVPAPLAAAGLLGRLADAVPGLTPAGPLHALLDLAEPLAAGVARAGLIRPEAEGVGLLAVRALPDGLRLLLGREDASALPPLPEAFSRFAKVDRALAAGRASEVSQVCATALQQGQEREASMTRIAWCVAARPDDFPDAERLLERFCTLRPGLPAALCALATVHAARGEVEAAAGRLEALAAGPDCRPSERACALLAAGRLLARAGAVARAGDLLGEALQADASLIAALEALATLPDTVSPAGGPDPARATARLALAASDLRRASGLHRALGLRLLAGGDPDRARRHLERALALAPDDLEAEDALATCLLRGGQAPLARAMLEAAGRPGDLERLVARAVRLSGGSASAELPDMGELPPMGGGPETEPSPPDGDSTSGLPEVASPSESESEAEAEPSPPDGDSTSGLPEVASPSESESESEPEEPPRRTESVEITLVSEREAADQPELFVEPEEPEEDDGGPTPEGVLEAALALSGREDAGARRRLEALTAEPGGRRTLLEQLEGRQDVPALLLAAELHVAEDDPFSAEQALAAALEQEPKLPGALALLARLYRARESWKGYVQVLTQQAGLAGDRQRWGDLLLEVAQVRHERMGERKAALATVNAVLRAFPDRADALVLLAELLEAEARPADALAMLRRALDQPDLPDRLRVGVLERAARLAGLAGVPEQEVAAWWAEVLEHVPGHPAALEALQVHHEQRGNLRAELAVVEQRLDGLQGDLETQRARRVRSGLHARRAVLVLRLSGSGERARAELERAIEDWDENVEAYEALAGLYREEGETGRLLDVLERLEELMVPGPARNALAAERAALLAGGG